MKRTRCIIFIWLKTFHFNSFTGPFHALGNRSTQTGFILQGLSAEKVTDLDDIRTSAGNLIAEFNRLDEENAAKTDSLNEGQTS